MANAFRARFTAVHVEAPERGDEGRGCPAPSHEPAAAEQLGAKTVTLYGGDITRQIAEYARISGVSKIVLGRSYTKKKLFSQNVNFADQLTALVPRMEIYLIPDTYTRRYAKRTDWKA